MRVAFAGTPLFARVALEHLYAAGFTIPLVLTQPDRPSGRGLKPSPSEVKTFAARQRLEVVQPRGLRLDGKFADDAMASRQALQAASPDVMVVAAYGLILPRWVLELPRLGCLNVHASLLPRWRGAAPVQRAIEAGDERSGVTIMHMDEGLDTGDMLLAEKIDIGVAETAATLTERLAMLGARLVVEALDLAACGGLVRTPQPETGVTYAHKIGKDEAPIDWSAPAATIERRVRAFNPFPGASFVLNGEPVKVWRSSVEPAASKDADANQPGKVLRVDGAGIAVACGKDVLRLQLLQRPGGRRMEAADFLAGRPIAAGTMLAA